MELRRKDTFLRIDCWDVYRGAKSFSRASYLREKINDFVDTIPAQHLDTFMIELIDTDEESRKEVNVSYVNTTFKKEKVVKDTFEVNLQDFNNEDELDEVIADFENL